MRNNWVSRIVVLFLLLSLLPACGKKTTSVPKNTAMPQPSSTVIQPTDTLIPPTNTLTPPTEKYIPPTKTLIPTYTLVPTQAGFNNPLIYDTPGMYEVTIKEAEFESISEPVQSLPMHIFYPPNWQTGLQLPAVILANVWQKGGAWTLFDGSDSTVGLLSFYEGWGRMIAANGLIAIAYETAYPDDLEALVKFIQTTGSVYGIDATRLGLFGTSGNGNLVASFSNQENREYIKFAVYFYAGVEFKDSPWYQGYVNNCKQWGCYLSELPAVTQLRTDLPTFMVFPTMDYPSNQEDYEYYLQKASEQGVPITVVKFENGEHGFDFKSVSLSQTMRDKGSEIIQQAIDFMIKYASAP